MNKKPLVLLAACVGLFVSCRKSVQESANGNSVIPSVSSPQHVYDVYGTMNTVPGVILLTPYEAANARNYIMMTDERGQILYQKQTIGTSWNFQKWNIHGKTRYSYIMNDPASFHVPGMSNGYVVILDELLVEIKRINLVSHNDIIAAPNKPNLDIHDFILFSDDHYMSMAYYPKEVTNIPAYLNPASKVTVHACVMQEVVNGSVVWQWDATQYPELYETSAQGNTYGDSTRVLDYLHINSMIIDPRDNNIISSFRNTDQVLKIDHKTGDIIWRLGGKNSDFPMTMEQHFYRQHHATLVDNGQTLLLFDNGENTLRPYSRVLEFNLDETSKTITGFKAFNIPAPITGFTGSVQKIGAHYLIGGGSANYVLEIDPNTGERILDMQSPVKYLTYRALKYLN